MEKTNYFIELEMIECDVEKKNGLNYISWSDGWAELKKVHPEATYRKIKNGDTYLFKSGTGGSVECEVTVGEITHCADLAITDFKNQEIKYDLIKSTDIQNTLQRAFAKAIAMHGIGLYIYRGEDFPDDANEASGVEKKLQAEVLEEETVEPTEWFKDENLVKMSARTYSSPDDAVKLARTKYKVSKQSANAIRHFVKTGEVNLINTFPKE